MPVKHSKLITVEDSITLDPITILIELVDNGVPAVGIKTLDGEYRTIEEFDEALDEAIEDPDSKKVWNFVPLVLDSARTFCAAYLKALEAAEE